MQSKNPLSAVFCHSIVPIFILGERVALTTFLTFEVTMKKLLLSVSLALSALMFSLSAAASPVGEVSAEPFKMAFPSSTVDSLAAPLFDGQPSEIATVDVAVNSSDGLLMTITDSNVPQVASIVEPWSLINFIGAYATVDSSLDGIPIKPQPV